MTKEYAACGVSTDKLLWVREHVCPACGFEADRDANAVVRLCLTGSKREAFATAWDIFSRGLEDVGVGHSERTSSELRSDSDVRTRASLPSTPVETALPTGTTPVPAKRVTEAGSPTLSERTASAVSE